MQIDFARYVEQGYRVFPVNGKFPHFPALPRNAENKPTWQPFTQRAPTDEEIDSWQKENGYTGLAIILGKESGIIGLDYDCYNEYPEILKIIPDSPVIRIGKRPKWMRIFKYNPHLPSQKIKLKKINGVQDGIELLTDGRYFVAEGIHPETKEPYFYVEDHILSVNKDALPTLPVIVWRRIVQLAEQYQHPNNFESSGNGGRHDQLLSLCGKMVSAGVNEAEIIYSLSKLDSSFSESYFQTHKNTPEKMLASIKKTHERNLAKKTNSTVVEKTKEVSVSVDLEGTPKPRSAALLELIEMGVPINKHGNPLSNELGVYTVIENWKSLHRDFIWFDEFRRGFFTRGIEHDGPIEQWDNAKHLMHLALKIQSELNFNNLKKETLRECAFAYALQNRKNEVTDFIKSLYWDGVPRVDNFLTDCFGVDMSEYTSAASKNLWIGIIARAFQPGCKMDTMIVLEGAQGKSKSTALKTMVGEDWFAECHQSPDNKDFYVGLQGKLLVEIAELESFNKSETTTIKRMLSCAVDRFRAPYGEVSKDWPRQGVFVGTTNEQGYLKDSTGNRRFWPIKIGTVNLNAITENREQLFAEAYHRFKAGEDWYKMPEVETIEAQETRMQEDAWQSTVDEYLLLKDEVTIKEIAVDAMKIELKDINRIAEMRIASCLRRAGFEIHIYKNPFTNKTCRNWKRTSGYAGYAGEHD